MSKGAKEQTEGKYQILPLSLIQPNDGQIEGLPANPRQINEQKYELLKKNITDYPELLEYRGLLVYPHDGKYITIGGNMRLRALSELNYKEAPCAVLPAETTVEQLKAYIILDNDNFGQWDWDMLANNFDDTMLADLGLDLPFFSNDDVNLEELYSHVDNAEESKETKIIIVVPKEHEDKVEDIRKSIQVALEEWKGCKIN